MKPIGITQSLSHSYESFVSNFLYIAAHLVILHQNETPSSSTGTDATLTSSQGFKNIARTGDFPPPKKRAWEVNLLLDSVTRAPCHPSSECNSLEFRSAQIRSFRSSQMGFKHMSDITRTGDIPRKKVR